MLMVGLVLVLLVIAQYCSAWGNDGHRIVGAIAQSRLSDQALNAAKQLIGHEDLANVATW